VQLRAEPRVELLTGCEFLASYGEVLGFDQLAPLLKEGFGGRALRGARRGDGHARRGATGEQQ
jgi:hypothetical protein